jgi:hypothetical protein
LKLLTKILTYPMTIRDKLHTTKVMGPISSEK